jgi:hypothetical protein
MNPRRFLVLFAFAGPLGLLLVYSLSAFLFMVAGKLFKPTIYEEWLDVTTIWTFLGALFLVAGLSILAFGAIYMLYKWTIKEDATTSSVTE